jgi:hypothetical protein
MVAKSIKFLDSFMVVSSFFSVEFWFYEPSKQRSDKKKKRHAYQSQVRAFAITLHIAFPPRPWELPARKFLRMTQSLCTSGTEQTDKNVRPPLPQDVGTKRRTVPILKGKDEKV